MAVFMVELIYWLSLWSRAFLMVIALTICSRTVQKGVLISRCADGCSRAMQWEYKGVFCYLVPSALSWEGKQLPDCSSWSCSHESSHSAPPALCPAGPPAANRAGHLCHFHITKLSEFITNGLPRDTFNSLKFCLWYSNKRHPLTCGMLMPKGSREIQVRIWIFLLGLVSKRHNSPRKILLLTSSLL